MNDQQDNVLSAGQLLALEASLRHGSEVASGVLAQWIGRSSVVEIDTLEQLPLEEATGVLGVGEEPICFCATEMQGPLTGEIILAFDDASGLALADMLLDKPQGSTAEWTEMATSAALETTNILSCSYLNSLQESLVGKQDTDLLPSPPRFSRDFAESLLEFALMGQAIASDQVLLARTRFEINETPVNWTLLFVPDTESMARLAELLPTAETGQ